MRCSLAGLLLSINAPFYQITTLYLTDIKHVHRSFEMYDPPHLVTKMGAFVGGVVRVGIEGTFIIIVARRGFSSKVSEEDLRSGTIPDYERFSLSSIGLHTVPPATSSYSLEEIEETLCII